MDKNKTYTGYKATDKNMRCRGFQFELGKWYSCEGEIVLCENGFHFCEYPSGPWAYYDEGRLFKIEAKEVVVSEGPGSDLKHVARHIRLVEEIKIDGNRNTGDWNTGDWNIGNRNTGDWNIGNRNTGDWNTGNGNTGDWNTGNGNTGDWNTGNGNTGNWNTGNWNTGNRNTGDGNTGDWNTGDWNTGNRNTGNWNTGNRNTGNGNTGDGNTGNRNTGNGNTGKGNTGNGNTGYGNVGDYHSGCMCIEPAPFLLFDLPANRKLADFDLIYELSKNLQADKPFDVTPFLTIENATTERIEALHAAHIAARKEISK